MARQKTEHESEIALAHKVRKLSAILLRGNEQEREMARERLEQLLTKNRRNLGDVDRLIALSFNNPERTRHDDSDDEDEPPLPLAGRARDVFALVDWMLRRFLFLECHQYTALALWILHSFVFREFQHTPRLALVSPVRGCGKSVALNLCAKLCCRAHKLGAVSTAALVRLIDQDQQTLLLDEADNLDFANDTLLRAILNDGFEGGGIRSLVFKNEPRELKLFAPLALGAIGRLPLPLMSRSIVINMFRASPRNTKQLERFDPKNQELLEELDVIYRHAFAWAQQVRTRLCTDPPMPDRFYGRAADRWRVLFSIADALDRGDQARQAAKVFASEHTDEDVKIELLADIRRVFGAFAVDQIGTELLLQHLLMLDDNCWTEFRGEHGNQTPKPLSRHAMVTMISAFGVRSKTLWPPHRTAETKSFRGYTKAAFQPAWASYCDEGDTPTQSGVVRPTQKTTQACHTALRRPAAVVWRAPTADSRHGKATGPVPRRFMARWTDQSIRKVLDQPPPKGFACWNGPLIGRRVCLAAHGRAGWRRLTAVTTAMR